MHVLELLLVKAFEVLSKLLHSTEDVFVDFLGGMRSNMGVQLENQFFEVVSRELVFCQQDVVPEGL